MKFQEKKIIYFPCLVIASGSIRSLSTCIRVSKIIQSWEYFAALNIHLEWPRPGGYRAANKCMHAATVSSPSVGLASSFSV